MKFSKKSFEKTTEKVLENKYVLYFVFFLAIINLFGYLVTGNLTSIIIFVLIAYLTRCFNKNMIIVIAVPLVITSLISTGKMVKEGMENNSSSLESGSTSDSTTNATPSSSSTPETTTSGVSPSTPPETTTATPSTTKKTDSTSQEQDVKKASNPSSNPLPTTTSTSNPETFMNNKKNRIDYASTIEDAYTDLNKILQGDGIKQLTTDTQRLMQQQLELANAMKSMSPLLEQAKGLLQGFDLNGLTSLTKSLNIQ